MTRRFPAAPALLLLAAIAACSKAPDSAAPVANGAETVAPLPAPAPSSPAAELPVQPLGDDPATFVPLRSEAVKDAIHRALRSGTTQRWQDGKLSGYAVPSVTTGLNGCRAVRYTVDQRPGAGYDSINACDAAR